MTDRPLWTVEAMAAAMGATPAGPQPLSVPGISIDTRTVAPGEAFFAIKGDNRDGHEFVEAALAAGAGVAVVAVRPARPLSQTHARCSSFPMCSMGCANSRGRRGRARRRRSSPSPAPSARPAPRRRCVSRLLRDGETHASIASYNNHWGVPLSLARCPADRALRRVRDRHEPCRRDRAARRAWCGRRWRSSPPSSRCISNSSARSRRSPTPRPRSFSGSSRAARR